MATSSRKDFYFDDQNWVVRYVVLTHRFRVFIRSQGGFVSMPWATLVGPANLLVVND